MKNIILLLLSVVLFCNACYADKIVKNEEGRFIANLNTPVNNDSAGLMKSLELHLQWWTLLSEPVEYYKVKWQSSGQFKVDGITIKRSMLSKYPSLQKQFDKLTPHRIELEITGSALGHEKSARSMPPGPYTTWVGAKFKKDGKVFERYRLSSSIYYKIRDSDLVYSHSGAVGDGIVPGSPQTWNDYWLWGATARKIAMGDYGQNIHPKDFAKLSEVKQKAHIDKLKSFYKETKELDIHVGVSKVEWPLSELRQIASAYQKLEKEKSASDKTNANKKHGSDILSDASAWGVSQSNPQGLNKSSSSWGSDSNSSNQTNQSSSNNIKNSNKSRTTKISHLNVPYENTVTKAKGSLLMLIDTSGSMKGNRLSEAKKAANELVAKSLSNNTEVAVLSFSGDCGSPISLQHPFSLNAASLQSFINGLIAGGGTPMSAAVEYANVYMSNNQSKQSSNQMVLLLADGDDNCNIMSPVVEALKQDGILYTHQTVGLELDSKSKAVQDLKLVAQASGGEFMSADSAVQLSQTFENAAIAMGILDMIGKRHESKQPKPQAKNDKRQSIYDGFN